VISSNAGGASVCCARTTSLDAAPPSARRVNTPRIPFCGIRIPLLPVHGLPWNFDRNKPLPPRFLMRVIFYETRLAPAGPVGTAVGKQRSTLDVGDLA